MQKLVNKMQELKQDLEDLKTQRAKEEGRYEEALNNLKKLGFNSVEEANIALEDLEREIEEEAESLEELYNAVKTKYSDFIE